MTRLLFFDDTQLLEKSGLERRLGRPDPVPEATFQVPGIDLGFAYPTVFPNREAGGWRMLYQALTGLERGKGPVHFVPSVVDSSDGIHWRIPDLEASVPLPDRLLSNQVGAAPLNRFGEWGPCYYDDRAQDPRQRIKGFVCKGHGPGTGKKDSWIVTSPDGLTWNDPGGVLWHPYGSDPAVCAFWNRYRDSYVLSIRPKNGDRRIALMETRTGRSFPRSSWPCPPTGWIPTWPSSTGCPPFPTATCSSDCSGSTGPRSGPPSTASSWEGGSTASWPTAMTVGTSSEAPGNRCWPMPLRAGSGRGCILPCSLIATESEIRFYSCATAQEHAIFGEHSPQRSAILMHRLRPDGFVCLEAASGQGRLKTRALLVQGDQLSFNVQAPGGQLLVGITDADGNPIPGYALEDCRPCSADSTAWVPRWKDDAGFGSLKGRAVQLELQLRGGRLYAVSGDFQMLSAKEGMRYMRFGTPPDPSRWGP